MGSNVGNTLLWLAGGTVLQRLCQLLAILCVARNLGPGPTGVYAQGLAIGGVLCALAGTGIRNHVARAIVRAPALAGALVRAAVRSRLLLGLLLAATALLLAAANGAASWFLLLCCLQVVPAAFDQKGLLDAVAHTRREVAIEGVATLLQLLLTLAWAVFGGDDLTTLAAIALLPRLGYLLGALPAIRDLPTGGERIGGADLLRQCGLAGLSPSLSEVAIVGDVWFCGLLAGDAAAGLYSIAQRLAGAASVPSAQLSRFLLPHLHGAPGHGDPARTVRTALRAIGFVVLPLAAGGIAVAADLGALFGADFAAAGPALQFALLGVAAQHLGWQGGNTLYARGQDRAYAASLWLATLLHAAGLLVLAPWLGATGAGLSVALAQVTYLATVLWLLRPAVPIDLVSALTVPLLLALATGGAAWLARTSTPGALRLPLALLTGAAVMLAGLWLLELRGRTRRLGTGLLAASRLHRPMPPTDPPQAGDGGLPIPGP